MSEEKEILEENKEKELESEVIQEEETEKEEEIKTENRELADTKLELEETVDRLKRIMAEFEDYKKRSNKEREALYNNILSDIIESFLPVIDNLEKAVASNTEDEGYKQGVELVLKQFLDVLTKFGVEEIGTIGETFDPEIHDAVSSVQDESKEEKEIVEVYRKGYKIGTKVIRHAMVVVAN